MSACGRRWANGRRRAGSCGVGHPPPVAYSPIVIDGQIHASIRRLVRERVDLYLSDVHAMLRLPLPKVGIEAGCNFAIAEVLCAVISGLSRVFLPNIEQAGQAFKAVLAAYPHSAEPASTVLAGDFPNRLYNAYRNNVVHSLGINVRWSPGNKQHMIESLGEVKIRREKQTMTASELADLEGGARPAWCGPTIDQEGRTFRLNVEALYWGVRRMTQTLAATSPYAEDARRMLETADDGYGLSLLGVPGPRYQASNEISTTFTAVTSTATAYVNETSEKKS